MKDKADWSALYAGGRILTRLLRRTFRYGPLGTWERQLFLKLCELLPEGGSMLSVGCGRALIDYWLVRVLGVDAHLLDLSAPVLRKVHRSFGRTPHHTYHHDARTLPFRDGQFDVVWNAGVWEHFPEDEIISGVAEMGRVSRGFVLVLVPYSECKPYMLAKKWLEDHGLWSYGDEYPKKTLRPYFEAAGMTVVDESLLGGEAICRGYVGSISDPEARSAVASQLQPEDFAVWPYLVTTATGLHPEARRTA